MKTFAVLRPLLELAAVVAALVIGLRVLTGLFGRRRRSYRVGIARQVALLFWPALCLSVGLPLVAAAWLDGHPASGFELGLLWALSGLTLGFAAPALLLHLRYYMHNHATEVVFEPKRNLLEVYEAGQQQPFGRADVARVEYVRCRSRRLFWSSYEYLQLHLTDGRVLTVTSLLLPLAPLAEFLRNANLHLTQRWFCII